MKTFKELKESIGVLVENDKEVLATYDDKGKGVIFQVPERSIINKIKRGMTPGERKVMKGSYIDDTEIVHNDGATMIYIQPEMTVGDARKKLQDVIAKDFAPKKKAVVLHPTDTRSIVTATDDYAKELKKQFHNKNTKVRIMKRKAGTKVYLDSKDAEIHAEVAAKLDKMDHINESINEARKYSVLDTKKNQIVSRPNITKAAAQKLVDKDPENRIMGSPEFIHDKRTAALEEVKKKELTYRIHKDGKPLKKGGKTVEIYGVAKAKKMVDELNKKHSGSKFTAHHVYKDGDDLDESIKLDEYGVMSKRAFKRKEHEFEAEMERKAAARKSAGDRLPRIVYINNKVWKKGGKPVEFKDLRHAQNVIRSLKKKNPDSEYFSIVADMYKSIGDVYKES